MARKAATRTAAALIVRPRMKYLGKGAYWVESRSHPGEGHRTTAHSCTCPAYRTCWHMKLVRQAEEWRAATERAASRALVSSTGTAGMAALREAFG